MSKLPANVEDLLPLAKDRHRNPLPAQEAFNRLSQRCWDRLYAFAVRVLLDQAIGERPSDLVNLALAEAWASFGTFQGTTEAEWNAWMETILQRQFFALLQHSFRQKRDLRRLRPLPQFDSKGTGRHQEPAAAIPSPGDNAIRNEAAERLEEALNCLPQDERIAIQLTQLEDWSMREVAGLLGRTPAAVGGLLLRGKRRLRKLLESPRQGCPGCGEGSSHE